jgi:hypothetical protein
MPGLPLQTTPNRQEHSSERSLGVPELVLGELLNASGALQGANRYLLAPLAAAGVG